MFVYFYGLFGEQCLAIIFLQKIASFPLNSEPLEFLGYLKLFLKHEVFNFRIFDNAPQCNKNLDLKKLFFT